MIRSPWTDVAPASWTRTYLGHLVDVRSGSTPSKDRPEFWDGDVPWVSPKDMKVFRIADSEDHVSELAMQRGTLTRLPTGVVLMVTRGMILDHTVPIAVTATPVTINQDMKALRARAGVDGTFLAWALTGLNAALLARVEEAAHGTKALRTEQWKKLPLALPSSREQRRIADFLDRKTVAIDRLVDAKEFLLRELRARRLEAIATTVTGAALADGELRPSGITWVPRIPKHWKVVRLKHLAQIRSGLALGRKTDEPATHVLPYLRVANVQNGYLALDDIATVAVTAREAVRFALQPGDVLMNEGGDNDKLGRGYVWQGEIPHCLHQNHVFAVRPHRGVNPYWLNFATQAPYLRDFFLSRAKQSTNLASISSTNLGESPVVMPPKDQADWLVLELQAKLLDIDRLLDRVATSIDRMREYRQSLITAAVTGELSVP